MFFDKHAGWSYEELARSLAVEGDLAPVQIAQLHRETASLDLRGSTMDSLTRLLRGALRKGWGVGRYWEVGVAGAFASWSSLWGGGADLSRIKEALFSIPPPVGWRPEPKDDPLVGKVFNQVWPPH